jgi:hypothetical protein
MPYFPGLCDIIGFDVEDIEDSILSAKQ